MFTGVEYRSVFLALLLAHLLGDFVFQSRSLLEGKLRLRASAHLRHVAYHYGLSLLVLQPYLVRPFGNWTIQLVLLGLVAVHAATDVAKCRFARQTSTIAFLVDQLVHLGTLALAAAVIASARGFGMREIPDRWLEPAIAPLAVVVAVIFAGGYLIRVLLAPLEPRSMEEEEAIDLANAGLYIGWLERVAVLLAVIARSPEAVGFVVAAKSIVRFPSLKDRPFAEYFLIGTLLSMLLAVGGGLILLAMGISLA